MFHGEIKQSLLVSGGALTAHQYVRIHLIKVVLLFRRLFLNANFRAIIVDLVLFLHRFESLFVYRFFVGCLAAGAHLFIYYCLYQAQLI